MYTIDKKFNNLMNVFNTLSKEEIFDNIKNKYLTLSPKIQNSIESFFLKFPYWGKLNKDNNEYESLYNRTISLKEHVEDYIWLYNNLSDYRSKKLLYAILNNWYEFDFVTIDTAFEKNFTHYFDMDIVKCDKNEVICDVGAYTGDTIIDYINTYGKENYKHIYAYEITHTSFEKLKNNLKEYPNITFKNVAISNDTTLLFINENNIDSSANTTNQTGELQIPATTLDIDIKEPISLIKMDIEGGEEKAIIGSYNHIKNDKPKLLISVYHNHEDLWKIPRLIHNYNNKYKFYLRCYGTKIFPTEIVLIAV